MRHSNRLKDEIREIEIIPNFNPYAEGSCLIKCGGTHVVCTASVEEKVPAWLKGCPARPKSRPAARRKFSGLSAVRCGLW